MPEDWPTRIMCNADSHYLQHATGLEEALVASLADAEAEGAAASAPPAAKHIVKALVRETLTEERLEQLGGAETQCAVCRYSCLHNC